MSALVANPAVLPLRPRLAVLRFEIFLRRALLEERQKCLVLLRRGQLVLELILQQPLHLSVEMPCLVVVR